MENTQHFKDLLEKEAVRIEAELATVAQKSDLHKTDWDATEPNAESVDKAEDGEVASGMEEFENNTAIVNELETQLADIKVALAKIESGAYGVCETSGEPIETDRLEANPAARTCKAHMS
jgi:RNA polymerase-binding transcription factor DksA